MAGTTAHAFFAGAIVAQGLLAEDILASVPWKFDEQVLGGSAANVRIPASGSIPASYLGITWRHLQIRWHIPTTTNATPVALNAQLNGDAGANYITAFLDVVSASPTSLQASAQTAMRLGALSGTNTAGNQASGVTDINDFASSTLFRSLTSTGWRADSGGTGFEICGGQWSDRKSVV